jgi:hypothetical protein
MTTDSVPTRLEEYIKELLPWAHGHQRKAITTFVAAILDQQTGCQAQLARTQGNQEAAVKRLGRLLHNQRLQPKDLAEWLCRQALSQLPGTGKVRFTIDWTSEGPQHLLVVSLVVGRRALPIFWRAYDQTRLKGRMSRYELAVVKRAFQLIFQYVAPQRVRLTADRGLADDALFALLEELGVDYILRVKGCVKVLREGQWIKLNRLRFVGNARRRNLGRLPYCESSPRRLWITMSRARNRKEQWGLWFLVSNRPRRAQPMASEYGHRFCCEEGFRDAKWYLGFAEARLRDIRAWSRLFALFAIALLALTSLGMCLLLGGRPQARWLLRRVVSRRGDRCELSLIAAVIALLRQDPALLASLSARTKLNLEATLSNVS